MKPVNKLDDIWEFEKFIQSIINGVLEAGLSLIIKMRRQHLSLDKILFVRFNLSRSFENEWVIVLLRDKTVM